MAVYVETVYTSTKHHHQLTIIADTMFTSTPLSTVRSPVATETGTDIRPSTVSSFTIAPRSTWEAGMSKS